MAVVTPPQAQLPARMPAAFFQLSLNGQSIGAGLTEDFTELPAGQYVAVIGELLPIWEPGMRSGRGSFSRFQLYGASLIDLMIAAGITTAEQVASQGIDFRFISFTGTGVYNDGVRQRTITLAGVQITEHGWKIDRGDQNIREAVSFAFQFWAQS